jgi:chaperonin GroES
MIRPLGDKLIVKMAKSEEKSVGGIILLEAGQQQKPEAEVVAVGSGQMLKDGTRKAPAVKVGDKVIFALHTGMEIKINGEDFAIVKEQDILAIRE